MPELERFEDRVDAGRRLARKLTEYAGRGDVLVLGLPRGGVPVAYEVAVALQAELDVFLVRKLGVPGHEELAMGAITLGGMQVLNDEVLYGFAIPPSAIEAVAELERKELERRAKLYRGDRKLPEISGRPVIVVDDGIATGATGRVALEALRLSNPSELILAVPVAARSSVESLRPFADRIICEHQPEEFLAVSVWYRDFRQVRDRDVRDLLRKAQKTPPVEHASPAGA